MKYFTIFLCLVLVILFLCNDGELVDIPLPSTIGYKLLRIFPSSDRVSLLTTYFDDKVDMAVVFDKEYDENTINLFDYDQYKFYSINVETKKCTPFSIKTTNVDHDPKEFLKSISSNLEYRDVGKTFGIESSIWNLTSKLVGPMTSDDVFISFANRNWIFPHRFENRSFSRPVSLISLSKKFNINTVQKVQYEFYFLDVVDSIPEDIFYLPLFRNCIGYTRFGRKSPVLVKSFQMEEEAFDDRREKSEVKMYVDSNAKVLREDVRVIKDGFPSYIVTIIDATFGIIFTFDEASGKCLSTNPLPPFYRPSSDMRPISVGTMFLLENLKNLQYIGKRTCWLGKCEVWKKSDADHKIHEIYLKRSNQYVDGIFTNVVIPVRMDTFRFEITHTILINQQHFFNFEPKYPDWSLFDISECYDESNLLRFQVTFRGSYYSLESIINFEREFIETINKLTKTPTLRINKIRMDSLLNEMLLVSATLIEDPKRANITGSNHMSSMMYRRKNIDVYNMLSDAVDEKKFVVTAKNASGFILNFTAETITKDIMSEKEIDQQGSSLVKFTLTRQKAVASIPSDLVISNTPVDECARICDQEQSSTCDMFMYCKSTATCTLSEKHVEDRTDTYANTDCDLYSREYAYDYKLYEGVRLKLNDDSIVSGLDLRLCLSECFRQQNDSVACHSIDYCTDGVRVTCTYHSRHITQVSSTEQIPDILCIHYSQNFVEMYHYFPGMKWIDAKNNYAVIKRDVDLNECAQSCTLDPAGCTDFEMCEMYPGFGRKTQCILYEPLKSFETYPKNNVTSNTSCDHYSFKGVKTKFNSDDIISSATSPSSSSTSAAKKSGYSGSDMAGLGIGMLLIGTIIGFIVVYFYTKQQTIRGNNQNMVLQLINR